MANPPPLSDYERLRNERIQRNNERLASLGLSDAILRIKPTETPKTKRVISSAVTPSPTRASKRIKRCVDLYQPSFDDYSYNAKSVKLWDEHIGNRVAKYFDEDLFLGTITAYDAENDWFTCVYDDEDKEDLSRDEVMEAVKLYQQKGKKLDNETTAATKRKGKVNIEQSKSKFRCEIPLGSLSSTLSEKQKKIINAMMEGDFLGKFEDYLTMVDEVSDSNRRNVLRQIGKLANGEGIRYDSKAYGWPEGCYFMKGVKIGPHDDILKLMDVGQQCENEWGRDHGNGWLLSHPLKKLYMFQQYCLKEKVVYI
jgi:hypothetical protein